MPMAWCILGIPTLKVLLTLAAAVYITCCRNFTCQVELLISNHHHRSKCSTSNASMCVYIHSVYTLFCKALQTLNSCLYRGNSWQISKYITAVEVILKLFVSILNSAKIYWLNLCDHTIFSHYRPAGEGNLCLYILCVLNIKFIK
jgi:hypothetical protein